jgi:hypothetical protein
MVRGNHFNNVVGTNHEVRRAVAQKIKEENKEQMTITYLGHSITLTYKESVSGKSFLYESEALPVDVVKSICANDTKAVNEPSNVEYRIKINDDLLCFVETRRRRHEGATWKQGQTIWMNESDIIIC